MPINQDFITYLKTRRSVPAKNMSAPGPRREELSQILEIASRVPDHGKLAPFYFIVFEGTQREVIGQKVKEIFIAKNPEATAEQIAIEEKRFLRAPSVVAVVFRPKLAKHPIWEQIMCAGAVCMNMIHGAQSHGYCGQWLSEWYSFDVDFKEYLGIEPFEEIAGFIHIGSSDEKPADRQRPDLENAVTYWQDGARLLKDGSNKEPNTAYRFDQS